MSEIEPYNRPIKKKTAKEIEELQQAAIRERKKLIEAALTERAKIAAEESSRAYQAELRIDNGYQLASRTALHANQLNRQITHTAADNPGHEVALRGLEETVLFGAQALILKYMTR